MKMMMAALLVDKVLRECIEHTYQEARLGRTNDLSERNRVLAQIDLEIAGVAMRYVDAKGRIAWRATRLLCDHLEDLRLDPLSDFEHEDT